MTGAVGFGVFSVGGDQPRVGFRVGHGILDLAANGLGAVFEAPALNPFLALGRSSWRTMSIERRRLDSSRCWPRCRSRTSSSISRAATSASGPSRWTSFPRTTISVPGKAASTWRR